MKRISTRVAALLAATAFTVPFVTGTSGSSAETALKVIPHADLKNVDPIWTTAYITRNHGYMVYDTLFALDENLKPQPQMAEGRSEECRVGKEIVSTCSSRWSLYH